MRTAALMIATLALNWPVTAQENTAVYKVDFNIHDGRDSAAKDGRHYTLLVRNNDKSVFQVGDKVPYSTGTGPQNGTTQYQYADTGVNLTCIAREMNEKVAIHAEVDLSAIAPNQRPSNVPNPTIAQTRVVINAILSPGQPTLVASFDDPVTTRKLDVEVTASKAN